MPRNERRKALGRGFLFGEWTYCFQGCLARVHRKASKGMVASTATAEKYATKRLTVPVSTAKIRASVETMIMKASALRHLNGITVADLIAELETMNQDAKVLFVCDYGDYHHTQQALPVNEIVEADTGDLEESAYSQSRVAFIEERDANDEPDEDGEDETEPVVILR